jgi:hypothetical protein
MSIYIQKLLEARAASRELRSTKGTEESPITGKETRFVPTAKQEAGLSDKAKRKLASHRRRLAARTQDVASDAEQYTAQFKKGSSMKESVYARIGRNYINEYAFIPALAAIGRGALVAGRAVGGAALRAGKEAAKAGVKAVKQTAKVTKPFLMGDPKTGKGGYFNVASAKLSDKDTGLKASLDRTRAEIADKRNKRQQQLDRQALEQERQAMVKPSMQSESKKFKHPLTAKFLSYRQGKQTEKASKELERTNKKPTKFDKKVNKLMGKKKYSDQTPADMWREIHGNAKKGVEKYKAKRDAQLKKDEEGD